MAITHANFSGEKLNFNSNLQTQMATKISATTVQQKEIHCNVDIMPHL